MGVCSAACEWLLACDVLCPGIEQCARLHQKVVCQGHVAQEEPLIVFFHVDSQRLEEGISPNAQMLDLSCAEQFLAAVGPGLVVVPHALFGQRDSYVLVTSSQRGHKKQHRVSDKR